MHKYLMILCLITLSACGRGGVTQQAQNSFQTFEAEKIACNGTGTGFSGSFVVSASSGRLLCDGSDPVELSEAEFRLDCTQADNKFTCVNTIANTSTPNNSPTTSTTTTTNPTYTWSGCVNQDGTFIVGIEANGSSAVTSASQNGFANAKYLTKLNGSVKNPTQGKIMMSVIATSIVNNKTIGCLGSWPVSINHISQ